MFQKHPLHQWLIRIRAELRAGVVPASTPAHLIETARIWNNIEDAVRDPSADISHLCKLVSECAAGMLHTRRQVAVVLERLTQAPAGDLERIDRALAEFSGLDPQEYFHACQLALWSETERLKQKEGLIPQVVAQKVAAAVEKNVPSDERAESVSGWGSFVLPHLPLNEGLRIVRVASKKEALLEALLSFYPGGHPDAIWRGAPHQDGARVAIQERDRSALRSWVRQASAEGEFKDMGLSVLVLALAEAERCEEALGYLTEIGCRRVRDQAALDAICLCAEMGRETEVEAFLPHLTPGRNWVKGRVELMRAHLRMSGDAVAAATEMEETASELALGAGHSEGDGERSHLRMSVDRFSAGVRRELAIGWRNVVWARLDAGQYWEALEAAKNIFDELHRSGAVSNILAETQRRICTAEALQLAEAVLNSARELDSFEHTKRVLRDVIDYLAHAGSPVALQFAFKLIDEKMAAAECATREELRQSALRNFVSSPPSELSFEEMAAFGNQISSAAVRADCLYALALHAAVEGEWDQCERLERRAERSLQVVPPEPSEPVPVWRSAVLEEKPGIPEMLHWMRSRQSSEEVQSEPRQWFSEAIALAGSLQNCTINALYAVGCLLMESPSFPERGDLYTQTLKQLDDSSGYLASSLFRNALGRRAATAFWDPVDTELPEPVENQKKQTSQPAGEPPATSPRLLRKHFVSALAQIENGAKWRKFVSNLLEDVAARVLHPIRKPVVEALFEAARSIDFSPSKAHFSAMMHALALQRGETPEACWVVERARRFAQEAGVLLKHETEVQNHLSLQTRKEAQSLKSAQDGDATGMDFEAAFVELETAPDPWRRIKLLKKAIDTGDNQLILRAFAFAGEGFALETARGGYSIIFEDVSGWPLLLGKLPSRADRLDLLRRMWDWHDWFGLQDSRDFGIYFVPAWAGQMAAAGEIDLALETVERLRHLEHRTNGYAELAIGCGLTQGDSLAEELFCKFVEAARELITIDEHQQGADFAVRRIAMVCAVDGDHHHLLKVVALSKEMLVRNKEGSAHYCLLLNLLEALSVANRTDIWGEILDSLVQSKQTRQWRTGQMFCVVSELWEKCRHHPEGFTLAARIGVIEKFCLLMRGVQQERRWGAEEALLLKFCLFGSEDVPQILARFEAVSSCSSAVVGYLLDRNVNLFTAGDAPAAPDDQMLRWIANICPYSDEAALDFVGHIAGRCLHRNDWRAIHTLAKECQSLELNWLKHIAEAVEAVEADE